MSCAHDFRRLDATEERHAEGYVHLYCGKCFKLRVNLAQEVQDGVQEEGING